MQIRQSDLASFQRCAQQVKLKRQAQADGWREPVLSATAAGSVYHYAAQVLIQLRHEGREDALEVALATFERYWDPAHIHEVTEGPVDEWIARDTWGGMRRRHLDNLRELDTVLARDKGVLLAVEHTFDVPIVIDGEVHTLHGTVDMLKLRMIASRPVLSIDDHKTYRREHMHLDLATQWTLYAYASLDPAFWTPFFLTDEIGEGFAEVLDRLDQRGMALYRPEFAEGFDREVIPRRGRIWRAWNGVQVKDCGWRTEAHYARLKVQLREYVNAVRAGIYPLTVDGHVCTYCPFNRSLCPLPEPQEDIE